MAQLIETPRKVAENHFLLKIKLDGTVAPKPGQFVNIRPGNSTAPLLRKPISVFNYNDDTVELIVQSIGPGTKLLCNAKPGAIDILGPLGRGFTEYKTGDVLLIGGGVGCAPLYFLAKRLKAAGCRVTFIYGARAAEFVYLADDYSRISDSFFLMTDDGSAGEKGLVTHKAAELFAEKKFDAVCICGPLPMMKAAAALVPKETLLEASMETYFACGIGMCSGCAVETNSGMQRACVEGPVFNGKNLLWDKL